MREVPFGRPMIGDEERAAVADVLQGHVLTHGPRVKKFEAAFSELTGADRTVAVSSATAGLHLAYFHLGLGPGDEVIVPSQTHVATAHAVRLVGADPVFVDAEPVDGNPDLDQVEAAVTERTRAISIVHYLGRPVDMDRLGDIARAADVPIIEDCALAIGTRWNGVHAGLHGDIGCFSFYPIKHMTTAEGGAVIGRNLEAVDSISCLRAFGIDRNIVSARKVPGQYDVQFLGLNYRMNELSAAIGIEQIRRIPNFLARRRENFDVLCTGMQELDELDILQAGPCAGGEDSRYCLVAVLRPPVAARRDEVVAALGAAGVGTSVYYPRPVPHMTYYRQRYGFDEASFPNAARISGFGIAFPVGPHLSVEDMEYVVGQTKLALSLVMR